MLVALALVTYRRRWSILVAALVFILVGGPLSLGVFSSLKAGGFFDPNAESTKVAAALQQHLALSAGPLVVLFTGRDGATVDRPEYRQAVEATLARITGQPGIANVVTYYNTGLRQFVSTDRHSTYAVVALAGDDDTQVKRVAALRPLLTSPRLQVRLGGRPAVYQEVDVQIKADLAKAELTTFPLVAILLVVIFRSVVAAALPLLIGATATVGAFLALRLAATFTDVSVFAVNIITLLSFGLAIDYGLFIVSRFREELAAHEGDVPAALSRTLQTAGHTVLFSGLTVMMSLLSLLVFSPMFVRTMGFGGAMAVLVAVVAALTILPALLAVLGERVNMLSVGSLLPGKGTRGTPTRAGTPGAATDGQEGFWYRTSHVVMRHPWPVLLVTLIPVIWVGLPFLRINFSVFDARSLPPNHESRVVNDILTQRFPRNETQPIEIVVRTAGPVLEARNLGALFDYSRRLAAVPGVRRVDSLVTLAGRLDKAAYISLYSRAGLAFYPQAAQAARHLANGPYTVVSVLYDSQPYAPASRQLVGRIRALPVPAGLSVQVGGEPAYVVDFLSSLGRRIPLAFGLIIATVFVLLFVLLGSLVVPLKAVVLTILSLSFSFGALVWVFQDGHLSSVLGFTRVGSIDSTTPVLVFAGIFGLSMDYEVFLLSRIKEHYDRTGDTTAAVAVGLQKSGTIITSAALLLVVVASSFAAGEALSIKQIGLCLSLAILVDATVVRTLLLPAVMRLMGAYNWWAPAPLTVLYRRLNLRIVAGTTAAGGAGSEHQAALQASGVERL